MKPGHRGLTGFGVACHDSPPPSPIIFGGTGDLNFEPQDPSISNYDCKLGPREQPVSQNGRTSRAYTSPAGEREYSHHQCFALRQQRPAPGQHYRQCSGNSHFSSCSFMACLRKYPCSLRTGAALPSSLIANHSPVVRRRLCQVLSGEGSSNHLCVRFG